ncbi:MAG: leucine-rich repeat protein [Oscillospiraceae bacterium]|nr:leucine-rich repeat protein [Oscillospiraceae bacterium]
MKYRILAASAALMTAAGWILQVPVCAEETAKCGDSITWAYDADTKTLSLTGTGRMYDYEGVSLDDLLGYSHSGQRNDPPWKSVIENAEHIEVSDGIEYIGYNAFKDAESVQEITMPDSVTEIGCSAFKNTSQLETVHLSKNLRTIGDEAFSAAVELSEIILPDGLESIGTNCFSHCLKLSELEVPKSVTYIGKEGLSDCIEWVKAQRKKGDFLIVGDGILYQYFGKETSVTVPDGVKVIGGNAWTQPRFIESATYRYTALNPRNDLESVSLPDSVTEICPDTFRELEQLQSVRLPENLKHIGTNAFRESAKLSEINLPDGLLTIGEYAFYGCKSLADLTVPQTVTFIGKYALDDTAWLPLQKGFLILGDGCLYRYNGRDKVIWIPDSVRSISENAFSGAKIMEIRIPDTVKTIDAGAFDCKNVTLAGSKGSIAEKYAAENDLPFRQTDAVPSGKKDMTLDLEKDIWSFGNTSNIFGDDYYISAIDLLALKNRGVNTANIETEWNGSCVGLAISVILAKNGIVTPAQLQADAKTLFEVQPSIAVQSFINYYQCTQDKTDTKSSLESISQKCYRMVNTAKNVPNGESPFLLTFATKSASHGVVGYGQESGEWEFGGKAYDERILVWDPNYPDKLYDESCVYYDSKTLDYCIPRYDVHYADGAADNTAGIISVCNDMAMLNAYPHSLAQTVSGDINGDKQLTVADAVLLARICAEDPAVTDYRPQDLDGDGYLTVTDVTELLKMLAGTK